MWKATAGTPINLNLSNQEEDEWETDPDFINDVTEQEQRWGSRTIEGSGRVAGGAIDIKKLKEEISEVEEERKKKFLTEANANFGYGGKYGIEKDRMDRSAVGHDYIAKVEKHASQKDYSTGFGGKFGVQTDRVDKSAVNWDYQGKIEKHASQKDYSSGFGGKFGVQTDRQDSSAVGWDHVEKVEKHGSQKDHSVGFGGKFGVQTDRQDKSAVGWDHVEKLPKHESQIDHKKGFGGKFGVQADRMDKSAISYTDESETVVQKSPTNYKTPIENVSVKSSDIRAKFENMAQQEQKNTTQEKIKPVRSINKVNVPNVVNNNVELNKEESKVENGGNASKLENDTISENKKKSTLDVEEKLETNKETENLEENAQSTEDNEIYVTEDGELNIVDTGIVAIALYDYQAAADDEISFDPDDIVTHIEMIDKGWWRGLCKGKYGLFPSNYVQLQEMTEES